MLKLDTTAFNGMIYKLKKLGGDAKKAVTDALTQAGETITADTRDAIALPNLPAGGIYSTGRTAASIATPKVTWTGTTASMGVGFDFSKPGAGGYLITGTPRMAPVYELQKIYKRKKYMNDIQNDMIDVIMDYLDMAEGR